MSTLSAPTPHNSAKVGDFAKTVLMPGDPLRAKFIAENFLEGAKLVNNIRGIHGYTGEYKGKKVSVMASGMGMPSISIYSYELFNIYGVETIIRIGSAGALSEKLKIKDIVIASEAVTKSNIGIQMGLPEDFLPKASDELIKRAENVARLRSYPCFTGRIISSDVFYSKTDLDEMREKEILAVEMEAAALYMNAYLAGKKAIAICTVSDSLVTGEALSGEERQKSFVQMMELALEIAD
ncbi:MAG: purine-nucleoside phosphorylase [Clostridiales bacterium]|nr:purine-nucleoside phosphorylase [Clostridiales bacterium]